MYVIHLFFNVLLNNYPDGKKKKKHYVIDPNTKHTDTRLSESSPECV